MYPDQRAGTFAVEIEIADMELFARLFDAFFVARKERAGQAVLCAIGDRERVREIFRLYHRQHRAENLLLRDPRVWRDIRDDGWLNKVAGTVMTTAYYQATLALADLDVLVDLLKGFGVNDRTHIGLRLRDITLLSFFARSITFWSTSS